MAMSPAPRTADKIIIYTPGGIHFA